MAPTRELGESCKLQAAAVCLVVHTEEQQINCTQAYPDLVFAKVKRIHILLLIMKDGNSYYFDFQGSSCRFWHVLGLYITLHILKSSLVDKLKI